jgi:histidinol dehydrogenase
MTAIPASVAGVAEIALCVPPGRDGRIPEVTLAAAALAGVDEVYAVGGAQAIAALAHGTESIRRVDVIVGPGNAYVSEAKREVSGTGIVGIESPAGPSELIVVADAGAPAAFIAADLVAQAEHGPGGAVILVTDDEAVAAAVDAEIARALSELPARRRAEAESTLEVGGRAVVVHDLDEALAVVNAFAPEHLELMTADPEALLPLVRNAGAVFVGPFAPTAYGDYVAGANHVLPTAGAARFSSALRVDDFCKHVHVVRADAEAAHGPVARAGEVIATAEGLDAHARSLRIRGES